MPKIVFNSEVQSNALSSLMEGYLSGLGEVCHTLFGARGEAVMYEAVGEEFKKYLKKNRGSISPDPNHGDGTAKSLNSSLPKGSTPTSNWRRPTKIDIGCWSRDNTRETSGRNRSHGKGERRLARSGRS